MFLVVVHNRLSLPTLLFLAYEEKHKTVTVVKGDTFTTYFLSRLRNGSENQNTIASYEVATNTCQERTQTPGRPRQFRAWPTDDGYERICRKTFTTPLEYRELSLNEKVVKESRRAVPGARRFICSVGRSQLLLGSAAPPSHGRLVKRTSRRRLMAG